MQFFYYLMLTHPDVQKRAQAELQAIVGPDRLPALKDRERLPFTESVWKETLRLHPATPLGRLFVPETIKTTSYTKNLSTPALYEQERHIQRVLYPKTFGCDWCKPSS